MTIIRKQEIEINLYDASFFNFCISFLHIKSPKNRFPRSFSGLGSRCTVCKHSRQGLHGRATGSSEVQSGEFFQFLFFFCALPCICWRNCPTRFSFIQKSKHDAFLHLYTFAINRGCRPLRLTIGPIVCKTEFKWQRLPSSWPFSQQLLHGLMKTKLLGLLLTRCAAVCNNLRLILPYLTCVMIRGFLDYPGNIFHSTVGWPIQTTVFELVLTCLFFQVPLIPTRLFQVPL